MAEEARLIVTQEDEPEIILDLTEERISIGRSVNNELVIKDANASRRHAEIRRVSVGRFRLFDIGSANGTWINGRRVTSPKQLKDGDEISIGAVKLRFVAPQGLEQSKELSQSSVAGASRTRLSMRNETILVLVSDIRNYTGMSEALPAQELSSLVSDWFRDASKIIEDNGGTIDKFIGDAVMAYWILPSPQSRTEANSALRASKEMIKLSEHYSEKVEEKFPGHTFRVGIGLNVGDGILGNVGAGVTPSITVVGDSVNIAFRIEALTKEKGHSIIASRAVADCAESEFQFKELGKIRIKGRKDPVSVWALLLDQ